MPAPSNLEEGFDDDPYVEQLRSFLDLIDVLFDAPAPWATPAEPPNLPTWARPVISSLF